MQNTLPPQIPYQQPYAQRGGYRGRGCGHYLPMGASQGQYQQQVHYGVPTKQYGGNNLQPYQAQPQQYGRSINNQGFQNPFTNVKRCNNWKYCHTHVFDVTDQHESLNFHNPSWNHNWQATH